MKLIFGTTNKRKIKDLKSVISEMNLEIEVISLDDIGWDRGEIEEFGSTILENSLIKARAIYSFCKEQNIHYPIITDDAGLFVDALNGEPGIFTARYADNELKENLGLPKHQAVIKLLKNLENKKNRSAEYKCCVTIMLPNGKYHQETSLSKGTITNEIIGNIQKPYFYSIFKLNGSNKVFSQLSEKELSNTYRFTALKKSLKWYIKKENL